MKQIITDSIKERKAVISLLLDFNFRWHGEDWDIEEIERQFPHSTYPIVRIRDIKFGDSYGYEKYIAGNIIGPDEDSVSFLELISILIKNEFNK